MQHYDNLSALFTELYFHPKFVYNMDETMIEVSTGDRKAKVLAPSEARMVYVKDNPLLAHMTLVGTIRLVSMNIWWSYVLR